MENNVVNWFEIPVNDLGRAKEFYKNVIGVEAQDMQMPGMEMAAFPWVQGGQNTTGALVKSEFNSPQTSGTMVFFQCGDCADALSKAEANGGSVAMPKTSIGEFGFIGQIIDSEGNKVGLHSEK